jgi:hypothetical protein
MLVIRIEEWPYGDESRKKDLGVAHIANDVSGTLSSGNYWFKLFKSPEYAKSPGIWKKGNVYNFPRKRLGPWDLLYRVLKEGVGDRNKSV